MLAKGVFHQADTCRTMDMAPFIHGSRHTKEGSKIRVAEVMPTRRHTPEGNGLLQLLLELRRHKLPAL